MCLKIMNRDREVNNVFTFNYKCVDTSLVQTCYHFDLTLLRFAYTPYNTQNPKTGKVCN